MNATLYKLCSCNPGSPLAILNGVIKQLWWQHRLPLLAGLSCWFLGVFVLQLVIHPVVVAVAGSLYGAYMGARIGGSQSAEGAEEFTFALPVRRETRFVIQFLIGYLPILFLALTAVAAIKWSWPQAIWGLIVDSGFTAPFPHSTGLTALFGLAMPPVFYTFAFVMALLARSTKDVNNSLVYTLLLAGAPLVVAQILGSPAKLEYAFTQAFVLLVGMHIAFLVYSWKAYLKKEVACHSADRRGAPLGLFIVMLILFLLLLSIIA